LNDPVTAKPPVSGPPDLVADVVLADGSLARLRPISSGDRESLRAFHDLLSDETKRLRFFSVHPFLSEAELDRFVTVDYKNRLALVAVVRGQLAAVGRYDRLGASEAEVAFTVRDDLQGKGIATVLLEHLAAAARERGIDTFVADVLAENRRMLDVFRQAGFAEAAAFEGGAIRVTMTLEDSTEYRRRVDERERRANAESMRRLLAPSSVALVGASARPFSIGRALVDNILASGFVGRLHPVNLRGGVIAGLPVARTLGEVDGPVDLAIIAVPASAVPGVLEECGRKGVSSVVVISAGFAETGPEGAARERTILEVARNYGIRMVGPNCMGIVNMAEGVRLNATFAPVPPEPGPIGFSSQSGGLGIAILEEAGRRGLGVTTFVSVGNKADVSGNDLLLYWEDDPATEVVLLYLESFGNPRRFGRIARRLSRKKPIVAVKSGRTTAGSRGASSHTAALASSDDEVDALFAQTGVIRVDTLEELFDVADVLAHQPLPRGRAVAIVGNAGGPGVLAADACERYGLEVPLLSAGTQARLREFLSPDAAVSNPVDCIASASAEDYRRALEVVLDDETIDAAIVIFTPPLVTQADDVAEAVAAVAADSAKPVVANFLAVSHVLSSLQTGRRRVPWFAYPESAARALGKVVSYATWRNRPEPLPVELAGIKAAEARTLVEDALAETQGEECWLEPVRLHELLSCYGIAHVATRRAGTAAEAVAAATELGFPVVLKLEAPGVVHKSDAGGVRLGIASPEAAEQVANELLVRFGDSASLVVQPMAEKGIELIAGLVQDPSFGPVLLCGMGGVLTELLGDHGLSLLPLSREDARRLLGSLRLAPLLEGYRGSPPADIGSLVELLCRLSALGEDLPEVVELDLNPIIVGAGGAVAVDARARLDRNQLGRPPFEKRELRPVPSGPQLS
jgi:acetyl coenzyme A synthetase (ADP forming)-like protein